jgi:plastocyanin
MAIAIALAACGTSSGDAAPPTSGSDDSLTITSRDMAFDQTTLTAAAGTPFSLELVNEDAAPHNIAIYVDSSATEGLFVGELITSTTIVYRVPALEAGTYFFRCDLHPEMAGTLVVTDGGG